MKVNFAACIVLLHLIRNVNAFYYHEHSRRQLVMRAKNAFPVIDYFATTITGMEKVLRSEIESLDDVQRSSIALGKSGVSYRGSIVSSPRQLPYESLTMFKL